MSGRLFIAATLVAAAVLLLRPTPSHILQLPAGVVELHTEMVIAGGTDLRGAPSGTVLRAAADFSGRALLVAGGNHVSMHDFSIDGNRDALEVRTGLPPSDRAFAQFTPHNGVLAEGVDGLAIERVRFRRIAGFAVLASRIRHVTIDRVEIADSGSRDAAGHNNTTGGILLEEGSVDFRVTRSRFVRILGNGVWTHSLYTSPRNARGLFAWNYFYEIGRDALQAGHAVEMRIEQNDGQRIGYPVTVVDALPVGVDTAGNVEASTYAGNRFDDINGKCFDLDGFHDGEVRGNVCTRLANFGIVMNNSNPDMQSRNIRVMENTIQESRYGGIFVIGEGHTIARNRLLELNTAHAPDEVLRSGIYLAERAERPAPARGNLIENNQITGYQMRTHGVESAPGIRPDWNTVRRNY